MSMQRRKGSKQQELWIPTQDLALSPGNPILRPVERKRPTIPSWPARRGRNRLAKLSITHMFLGKRVADRDVGQPGHAAPSDCVARRSVTRAVQVSAEESEL